MASFDRQYQRARMGGMAGPSASASSSMMSIARQGGYSGMGSPGAHDRGGAVLTQQRFDAFGNPQQQQQQQQYQYQHGGDGGAMSPRSQQQQHGAADEGKRPTNFLLRPKHQQIQQQQQQQAQHHQHLSTPARGAFGTDTNANGGGSLFSPHPPAMGQDDQQASYQPQYQMQHSASSSSLQAGTPPRGPAMGAHHRPHRPSGLRNEQGVGIAAGAGAGAGGGRAKAAAHVDPPISGLHDTDGGLGATSPSQQPSTPPTPGPGPAPPSRAGTGPDFGGSSSMMVASDGNEADRQLSRVQTHVSAAAPRTPGAHRHWHANTSAATSPAAEACVTVFGFTPEHAGHVLSEMGRCGTIVRKQHGGGNWIHLQFASRIEAQRALSRCGQVLHNVLMIGVIPCTDDDFIRDAAAQSPSSPGVLGTPVHKKPPRILATKKGVPGTPSAGIPTTATVSPSRSYVGALGDFLFSW